jgi:hypothetical protein
LVSDGAERRVNRVARQLLPLMFLLACNSQPAPRARLTTPSGTRTMDAWYGVFVEPLEGPNGAPIAMLVVAFVDPAWGCRGDNNEDSVSFSFDEWSPGVVSSTVLSRSGPLLGPTSGGSGQVSLSTVDDRYLGPGDMGPLVGDGGQVDGKVAFDFGNGLALDGSFRAPHCALLDFRNAP